VSKNSYIIPESILDFEVGTKYQIQDKYNKEWSNIKKVTVLCWSKREELRELIKDSRIRIVQNDEIK